MRIFNIGIIVLLLNLCACNSKEQSNQTSSVNNSNDDKDKIINTSKDFLKWYKNNYSKIKGFRLVPQYYDTLDIQYRIDFDEAENYLNYLSSSGYLSKGFIEKKREYFEKCDSKMLKEKQNDGYPVGLDFDIILYTQGTDDALNGIDDASYTLFDVTSESASVNMKKEYYAVNFDLKKNGEKWMIIATRWSK